MRAPFTSVASRWLSRRRSDGTARTGDRYRDESTDFARGLVWGLLISAVFWALLLWLLL